MKHTLLALFVVVPMIFFEGTQAISFTLNPILKDSLTKEGSLQAVEGHMDKMATGINRLVDGSKAAIDSYVRNPSDKRSTAYKSLEVVLGPRFESSSKLSRTFQHMKETMQALRGGRITIDDIPNGGSLSPEKRSYPVRMLAPGRIIITSDFFEHRDFSAELMFKYLMRNSVVALTKDFAFFYVISQSKRIHPMFPGEEMEGRPGDVVVNARWGLDYDRLTREPNAAPVLPYNPDMYFVLGYCMEKQGRPPTRRDKVNQYF